MDMTTKYLFQRSFRAALSVGSIKFYWTISLDEYAVKDMNNAVVREMIRLNDIDFIDLNR
jgi:hypothetical protein